MSDGASGPTLHATAVTLGESGILIRGSSGSGKSSLALALLSAYPARARLIADDRVELAARGGRLVASVPSPLAGLLEVRGQGIRTFPFLSPAVIRLVVDLVPPADAPRMPSSDAEETDVDGIRLRRLTLPVSALDGHVKVALAAMQIR